MSGTNWAGPTTSARGSYEQSSNDDTLRNNGFLVQGGGGAGSGAGQGGGAGGGGGGGVADGGVMGPPPNLAAPDGMPSMYRRPTQDEISAVLSQYAAEAPSNNTGGQFRPPMFARPSQMSMQSQPSGGVSTTSQHPNAGLESDAAHRAANQFVPQGISLDPATAAAAAAAYGHLGYGNTAPPPDSRRSSQAGNDLKGGPGGPGSDQISGTVPAPGVPGMMPGMQGQGLGPAVSDQMQMRGYTSAFPGQGNGFDASVNDDFGPGKKRRMTFGGQFQPENGPRKPGMMQHDSSSSMSHEYGNADPSPLHRHLGQGPQQQLPTRPPLLHRRSRSGSELAGNMPGFRGAISFDGFQSNAQGFSGPGGIGQTPPVFLSSHSHQASFIRGGPLPPSALGGHAASHPPGLGSQILRGVDVSASGSSAASDFTKRKGWTGRVVEELLDFVHVLDPDGVILFASPSAYSLTGWTSEELRGRQLTEFIHPQDVASVEREIDRMRSSNGELLTYYRFKTKSKSFSADGSGADKGAVNEAVSGDNNEDKEPRKGNPEYAEALTCDGEYVVFEASGHPYFPPKPMTSSAGGERDNPDGKGAEGGVEQSSAEDADEAARFKSESMSKSASESKPGMHSLSQSYSLDTPSEASSQLRGPLQCFFCSARPYPSKNTSMLDSFLELKLENEKLRLLIADMDLTGPDNDAERANFTAAYHPDLLKQELEGDGVGGQFREGINPMFGSASMHQQDYRFSQSANLAGKAGGGVSRNSMGSHPTSPTMRASGADELLAGVVGAGNESDDEATSPTAANGGGAASGSQGIVDDSRRKKKPKQDDGDHVCTDCGRVDSPEWRKGPLGPKTLCNACGLRWAKKIKRKGGDPSMAAGMLVQPPGVAQQLLGHGHPLQHSFGRAPDGQMQGMSMAPPGPGGLNPMGMSVGPPGMLPTSPIFATRPSFEDGHGHAHGPG
ncbi:white collar 2 type of transcription factor [Thecaphora frezii]